MSLTSLVFRAHPTSRYSVAALLGAIQSDSRLSELILKAPLRNFESVVRNHFKAGRTAAAFSVMSTHQARVQEEVRRLREICGEDLILIAGGPHASARPKDLLDCGFDYVIIGEGEQSLNDLLVKLMNDADPERVQGVVSKRTTEYPLPRSLPRILLDDYPPFALDMNVVGPVEVTRGCPYACKFCSTPFLTGGRVRHRSTKTVVHWLKRAVEERGFMRTWFLSPNALCYGGKGRTLEVEKLEGLLSASTAIEGLEEVFFGSFPSEVRPDFVTKTVLEMIRQYVANDSLQIGMQAGSDHVLELSNRGHSVEEGMNAVRLALDSGFIPHVDMIFGLPGERDSDLRASLDLCHSLDEMGASVHGHVFMPLPGSAFENMPAGVLNQETRKELGEMSRRGVLTGSWSNQEKLARDLESKQER
ncbi:MAG: TIGR04013 family B12-binding domain/radical SAM domain-containing protein [Candidatus Thorarchaeota archaeon]|nr:MAG: TIGR04013 family B12-binding domain/radical SAM domain-containing protein [Candidatus Thorarchaeota archaeon]